jgi:hypothetical protein
VAHYHDLLVVEPWGMHSLSEVSSRWACCIRHYPWPIDPTPLSIVFLGNILMNAG